MRVLVQNCETRRFYAFSGEWVRDIQEAHDFQNTQQAMRFCKTNNIAPAQMVLVFSGAAKEIILPIPSRLPDARWPHLFSIAIAFNVSMDALTDALCVAL